MALLDLSLILDYAISLAIVALPVEAGILLLVRRFERKVTTVLSSPDKRAELIHEVAAEIWQPIQTTDQRHQLVNEFVTMVSNHFTPERRQKLISEIGHGMLRALKEQSGSTRGVNVRQENAALMQSGEGLGALASLGNKKIDLPVIGPVTIPQALQIFQTLRGLVGGGGIKELLGSGAAVTSSGGGSASQLP
jgi:hypothetical protein